MDFVRRRSIFVLCVAGLLWGSSWIAAPLLSETAQPFAASALTFLLAAAVAALTSCMVRADAGIRVGRVKLRVHLVLGAAMFAVPVMLLLATNAHGSSGWVPLLYSALPLGLAFVAGSWSAAMVVAVGAMLVLLNGAVEFSPARMLCALPAFGAVVCQGFALRYASRHLLKQTSHNLVRALAIQLAMAAGVFAAGSLVFDPAPRLASFAQWNVSAGLSLAALAFAGTALAYALLYWLLARGDLAPEQVAVVQWLQTLVAVGEGLAFAHARPPWLLLVAALTLAGCAVATLLARKEDAASLTIAARDTPPRT